MRRIFIWMFVFLSACAAPRTAVPTSPPEPTSTEVPIKATSVATFTHQITATPAPFFEVYGIEPIIPKGQSGAWDDRYTDPGAALYHNGMFHMLRNGFRDFPAESQVGYVTSVDGYIWTKQGDDPVFETKDVPYAKLAMFASSALVETDGTWVMYFYTWDAKTQPASVIGRAAAPNPMGPWAADVEPVLRPGALGDWDEKQLVAPHVLKTDAGYVMYYSGVDALGKQMIGMATSSDGIHWTKYNDPATTEKPFIESDPIFRPDAQGAWDSAFVHQPRVVQTSNGWVMVYRGASDEPASMKLGVATSADGIHWERYMGNPVFEPRAVAGSRHFWFTNLIFKDDVYYLFVESSIGRNTEIYLATHEGEIGE